MYCIPILQQTRVPVSLEMLIISTSAAIIAPAPMYAILR